MEGRCLHCGNKLYGRVDKKFCDSHCRSSYHHKNERGVESIIRSTNYHLRKNRRILKELNPNGKVRCHHKTLRDKGFDFELHTSTITNEHGNKYYFCYEYGYLPLLNDFFFLVKKIAS